MAFCPGYKWGQTDSHVIVTLDVHEEHVNQHDFTPDGKILVEGEVPGKGAFRLQLQLFDQIRVAGCQVLFKSRSMQIKLPKKEHGTKWKSLQQPHIRRPVQEKIDFDFYQNSDDDDDSSDSSSSEDERRTRGRDPSDKGLDPETRRKIREMSADLHKQQREQSGASDESTLMFGPFPYWEEGDYLMLAVAILHMYLCPFTKVEESFNMQATHDLLYHRQHILRYDHNEFPGVVPRTFFGAILNAIAAAPFAAVFELLYAPRMIGQAIVRGTLAVMFVWSLACFRFQLKRRIHKGIAGLFTLVSACQFHLLFYASRTLPNTVSALELAVLRMRVALLCVCVRACVSVSVRVSVSVPVPVPVSVPVSGSGSVSVSFSVSLPLFICASSSVCPCDSSSSSTLLRTLSFPLHRSPPLSLAHSLTRSLALHMLI